MQSSQTNAWLSKVDRVLANLLREQPQDATGPLAAKVAATIKSIKSQLSLVSKASKYTLFLPDTVLLSVFSFFENQGDYWACSLVNREWNKVATYELWKSPVFFSENALESFERTVAYSEKAELVLSLDLTIYQWDFWTNTRIGLLLESLPNLTSIRLPKLSSGLECPTVPRDIIKNLRYYEYYDTTMDPTTGLRNLIAVLKNAPNLEELVLLRQNYANSFLGKRLVEMVEELPTLGALRTMKFYGPRPGIEILCALLLHTPYLKSLAIPRENITEEFVETLFTSCPRIEKLNFAGCTLSTDSFDKLADRLVEMNMCGVSQRTRNADMAIARLITQGKSLEKLDLSGNDCIAPGLMELDNPVDLMNIKELNLSGLDRMPNFDTTLWGKILSCESNVQVLRLDMNFTVDDKIGIADIQNSRQTRKTLQAISEHCKVLEELLISSDGDIRPWSRVS
ncbi:hypothetical protein K493DRAFT_333277 [Basidiobolus meristosporus CBS 931.73]|uniref:F-box domain-containing protein n=1 Tax=Basidiobolus meristosporus CBS 931.73 TaxID=1314790 RepID=A0A1Y1Z8D2_9FUNG|nr:hypothetical protein K493DRAFT_333277 [Basidiobolus meristosporus CBS 931.73]|eukprot:ORY06075.1 hypothetical protein K493DRAFT_333277 [Basidiobolus meristosporus CBS 931.73]